MELTSRNNTKAVLLTLGWLVAYVASAVFCLQWAAIKGAYAAIWIPAGIGIAGLLLGGLHLWPVIFIGRFVAGQLSGTEQPLWAEGMVAAVNAMGSVVGVWLFQGRRGLAPHLGELGGMLRFIVHLTVLPTVLTAAVGGIALHFATGRGAYDLTLRAASWMFGSAASTLIIAGLVLSWRQAPLPRQDVWRFAGLLGMTGLVAAMVFGVGFHLELRSWHLYPLLIWAALEFGTLGASSALLISAIFAVSGVVLGTRPFAELDLDAMEAAAFTQQYLAVTGVTILILASVASERRGKVALEKARADLQRLNAELEKRVQERTEALRQSQASLLQAQKMEAIGQLTGGIAHDFNNLLQTISNAHELIVRRSEPTGDIVRYAEMGQRATQRGVDLTRQLLTFSRTQEFEMRAIEAKSLIEGITDLLRSAVGSAVTLELDLERAAGLHVLGDPTQLELMILNLATNARDAMPSGGRLIITANEKQVRGDQEVANGRYVWIQVTDTGHGMTPEVVARVFEPFFTTKGVGKGTGLGLSMAYGLAKQAGGKTWIESTPDQGTTVSVLLPLTEAVRDASSRLESPASPLPSGLRVLLVDDDDGVRATMAEMLHALGCKVRQAESGALALEMIEHEAPDLIVLDYTMPEMRGSDVVQALRARKKSIPIVMITGNLSLENLKSQAVQVLRKPFQVADLQRAAAAALKMGEAGADDGRASLAHSA